MKKILLTFAALVILTAPASLCASSSGKVPATAAGPALTASPNLDQATLDAFVQQINAFKAARMAYTAEQRRIETLPEMQRTVPIQIMGRIYDDAKDRVFQVWIFAHLSIVNSGILGQIINNMPEGVQDGIPFTTKAVLLDRYLQGDLADLTTYVNTISMLSNSQLDAYVSALTTSLHH